MANTENTRQRKVQIRKPVKDTQKTTTQSSNVVKIQRTKKSAPEEVVDNTSKKSRKRNFRYKAHLSFHMKLRAGFIVTALSCAVIFLVYRLCSLTSENVDKYAQIVLAQQQGTNTTLPYQRGDIVDKNYNVLATSVDVYNVILDCKLLTDEIAVDDEDDTPDVNLDLLLSAVAMYFPDIDTNKITTALQEKPNSRYVVLQKKVSYESMSAFQEAIKDVEGLDTEAIWFEKEYKRVYPYGSAAAATIGFGSGTTGAIGLEAYYNSELNGINGRDYKYYDGDDIVHDIVSPIDGNDIVTSIDINVQEIVEEEILNWNNEFIAENNPDAQYGSKHTAVIVMNPNTGEILAMASYPSFDLNDPQDLSEYYSEAEIAAMTDQDKSDALNIIWQNFCVSQTYEPGSTAKPFTVAAALDSGALNGDETFFCDGYQLVDGFTIHCHKHAGHGLQTIREALMNSCNDALMQIASIEGGHTFYTFQRGFGFGKLTGIDLPNEANTANTVFSEEELTNTASNLATNAFGQNFEVTMVQLCSAFCSVINGGTLYQPHLVTAIKDADGNLVKQIEPVVQAKTVSAETSEILRQYLADVVNEGTAKTAQVEGYSVGGKTGTAEKQPRKNGNYLVSFIGFAPTDNPEIVVYTIVDEPNTDDQAHSSFAQELTSRIMTRIFPYLGITSISDAATETESTVEAIESVSETTDTLTQTE